MTRLNVKLASIALSGVVVVLGASYTAMHRAITGKAPRSINSPQTSKQHELTGFRQIQFFNDRQGWALTSSSLWKTIDSGTSWHQVRVAPDATSILGVRQADFAQMQFMSQGPRLVVGRLLRAEHI